MLKHIGALELSLNIGRDFVPLFDKIVWSQVLQVVC